MACNESRRSNPRLEEARRTAKDRRSYKRYQTILLWYGDYPNKEIGNTIGRCPLTVHHYIEAYQNGGIEGLKRGASPGKPSKLSDAQQAELLVTIGYNTELKKKNKQGVF